MDRLPFEDRLYKFKKGVTYLYLDKAINRSRLKSLLKSIFDKEIDFLPSVNLDRKLIYLSSENPTFIRIASPNDNEQCEKVLTKGSYHYDRYISLSEISKQIIYPDE